MQMLTILKKMNNVNEDERSVAIALNIEIDDDPKKNQRSLKDSSIFLRDALDAFTLLYTFTRFTTSSLLYSITVSLTRGLRQSRKIVNIFVLYLRTFLRILNLVSNDANL